MSMLMLFSPGAPREEYFEQVAEVAQRGRRGTGAVPRPARQLLPAGRGVLPAVVCQRITNVSALRAGKVTVKEPFEMPVVPCEATFLRASVSQDATLDPARFARVNC